MEADDDGPGDVSSRQLAESSAAQRKLRDELAQNLDDMAALMERAFANSMQMRYRALAQRQRVTVARLLSPEAGKLASKRRQRRA